MKTCPICNKKLGFLKIGSLYWFDNKRFCSLKCKKEYKKSRRIRDKKAKKVDMDSIGKRVTIMGFSFLTIGFTILVLALLLFIIILLI